MFRVAALLQFVVVKRHISSFFDLLMARRQDGVRLSLIGGGNINSIIIFILAGLNQVNSFS